MQVPRYCDAISAIGKEDVLFDQVEHVDHNHRAIVKRRKTEIIHFTLEDLARAATNGIPVLSVEYLRDDPGNRSLIPAAAAEVRRLGYIPYFADRQLKKLHEIIAPPPADRPIA
jgi:endo-alpha-1,4-polygalactosaminidase (GH114 family)